MTEDVFQIDPALIGIDLKDAVWLYAPRRHASVLVEAHEVDRVSSELAFGGVDPSPCRWNRLILMPTNRCNFNCRYCYAAKGRDVSSLSPEACQRAIDDYVARSGPSDTLALGFLGGGEPCLAREVLFSSVDYARRIARARGIHPAVDISTNGSVMDAQMIAFFREYDVGVGISFDVLETVQEATRGHYREVSANIRQAVRAGVRVILKATITPDCVHLMSEMAQEAVSRYSGIRGLYFQPILDAGAFASANELESFCSAYRRGFFAARRKYVASLPIGDSMSAHAGMLVDRYCPGEYCVTPDGSVTACDFACTPKDPAFSSFAYGRVDDRCRRVVLDEKKLAEIRRRRSLSQDDCAACFAKYHCAGACPYRGLGFDREKKAVFCDFTRRFLAEELFQRFSDSVRDATGRTLGETLGRDDIRERFT